VLNPPAPESSNYPRRAGGPDENETFCYVAEHLQRLGVRVPRIDAFDKSEGILLLEDLGATRLADLEPTRVDDRPSAFAASLPATVETSSASKRRSPHSDDAAGVDRFEKAYLEAVEVLARIQSPGTESFDPQRTFNPAYDPAFVLRYEVDYFYREVAERYAGLGPASPELRAEFTAIAERAGNPPERVLMHRDYQSRNLMVTREGIAVIDFQGARLGPPAYDLASLLLDPYSELGSLRDRLFDHYLRVTGRGVEFRESFPHVALARLLQALGAFGYLGGALGKPGYLEHVPRALSRVASLAAPIYPRLAELAITIAETWGQPSR
jgi:aminoglycoside/choline kinase family phosphotransferase